MTFQTEHYVFVEQGDGYRIAWVETLEEQEIEVQPGDDPPTAATPRAD